MRAHSLLSFTMYSACTKASSPLGRARRCENSGISCSSVFSRFVGKLPFSVFLFCLGVSGLSLQVHAAAPVITQGAGPLAFTINEDSGPFTRTSYVNNNHEGRVDYLFNMGASGIYQITNWLGVQTFLNYSRMNTNDKGEGLLGQSSRFKVWDFGFALNSNYRF